MPETWNADPNAKHTEKKKSVDNFASFFSPFFSYLNIHVGMMEELHALWAFAACRVCLIRVGQLFISITDRPFDLGTGF